MRLNLEAVVRKTSYIFDKGMIKVDYTFKERLFEARRPKLYGLLTDKQAD